MKFYLHHHVSEKGSQIYLEFFSKKIGGRFIHPTGQYVFRDLWDDKNNWVKRLTSTEKTENKLRTLETLTQKYRDRINQSKEELKRLLNEATASPDKVIITEKTMLELYDMHLAQKTLVEVKTLRSYTRVKEIFEEFLTAWDMHKIKPSQYTDILHFEFESYLKKKYSENQHAKVIKRFIAYLKFITKKKIKLEYIEIDDIKYKEKARRNIALRYEDVMGIRDLDLSDIKTLKSRERLERLRDIIVCHALSGVRISDLFKLDVALIKGNQMPIIQQKSKKLHHVYIDDTVKQLLMKYGGKLPNYSEKEYRLGIKDVYKKYDPDSKIQVMEKDGIKTKYLHEEISSHDMVKTYITIASRHFKISTKSIAQTVGKTEKVINKHYLKDSEEAALDEFKLKWIQPGSEIDKV